MPSLNRVTLIGYIGKDPDVKYLPSGQTVASFSMATTEQWQADGEWQKKTEWHNLVAFGRIAEICGEHIHKGSLVYLEGKLQTRSWEDRSGGKRQTTQIVVSTIKNLSGKPKPPNESGELSPEEIANNEDVPF
jgi:single-strand DNA-binding protein